VARSERPRDDQKEKRILDADELPKLIEAVEPTYQLIFELAAETGGRISETLGLIWREVDFEQQTISITRQIDRQGQRVEPKTKRAVRTLEITPELCRKLKAHKLASAYSGVDDFVFATARGTAHDQRNIGGRVMARAVKTADLTITTELPAPTFHCSRYSHGSALIAAGWDAQEVCDRMGHEDAATTMRIYVRALQCA
jgi:integrase